MTGGIDYYGMNYSKIENDNRAHEKLCSGGGAKNVSGSKKKSRWVFIRGTALKIRVMAASAGLGYCSTSSFRAKNMLQNG